MTTIGSCIVCNTRFDSNPESRKIGVMHCSHVTLEYKKIGNKKGWIVTQGVEHYRNF